MQQRASYFISEIQTLHVEKGGRSLHLSVVRTDCGNVYTCTEQGAGSPVGSINRRYDIY